MARSTQWFWPLLLAALPALLAAGSSDAALSRGPSLLQRKIKTSLTSSARRAAGSTTIPLVVHAPPQAPGAAETGTVVPLKSVEESPDEVHHMDRSEDEVAVEGSEISQIVGSDFLGDSLEPTHNGMGREGATMDAQKAHGAEEPHHRYLALLFFFGALAIGGLLLLFLDRFLPQVPYTVALFVVGMFFAIFHSLKPHNSVFHWPSWFLSVEMWQGINPHLLFYAFLPALLFCEAMRLDVQLVSKCFSQVLILAGPGVVVGAFLVGYVARFVLPYGWGWPISLVFGTILSATDPVAVVALFNSLGVSPRLTMLISGESMLNDGTAIVGFALMLKVALGAPCGLYDVVVFFAQMTVTGVILGGLVGYLAVFIIGRCSANVYHSDGMIQVIITIACGYLTFFLAESEFSTSGVISTVSSGFVVAYYAWPRFVSRETMHTVWEAIEFIGNTLIFFLAGMLFASTVLDRWTYIRPTEFAWLLLLYVLLTLIRGLVLAVFWIPLHMVGKPIHWTEAVVIVWSGLRGAVSLALAIIVDMEPGISMQQGSLIMFHVGGIAALTFLINATTAAPLLKYLGISKPSLLKERMLARFATHMSEQCTEAFEAQLRHPDDARFKGANQHVVRAMVPALRGTTLAASMTRLMPTPEALDSEHALGKLLREAYLRVVQHCYWEAIEDGVIPRNLKAARVLVNSAGEALEHVDIRLNDWDVIEKEILDVRKGCLGQCMASAVRKRPLCWISPLWQAFSEEAALSQRVYICLCFQEAHARAQAEVAKFLPSEGNLDRRVQQLISTESQQQCRRAQEILDQIPADVVEFGKSEMLARKLLQLQQGQIHSLKEKGLLTESEASHMDHYVHQAMAKIANMPRESWGALAVAGVSS